MFREEIFWRSSFLQSFASALLYLNCCSYTLGCTRSG